MSASPFLYLEKFNYKTGEWEKVNIYVKNFKNELEPIDIWPWNGSHALFSVLKCENNDDAPECSAIQYGLPPNASQEIKDIYIEQCWEAYKPDTKCLNLADAIIYSIKHPTVKNYDVEWEDGKPIPTKPNPIISLIERINSIIAIYGTYDWGRANSNYRIIYWVSW